MVASLPFEVLRGVYLGILTGVVPALIAFGFGFGFRYITGIPIPGFAVLVLALALAGVNGGLLALADPAITQQANSVTLMTAILVVLMLALYTHAKGDQMAVDLPRRLSWADLRNRTVSADVVELVGGRGHVTVEVVGEVRDMEGYPPVPDPLREELQEVSWRFPADLTLAELESRMAERLRSSFDLQDVSVSLDDRGRASLVAAPPSAGVSNRVKPGQRAVSVQALVPTGVARGDVCTLLAGDQVVEGTVVSARTRPVEDPDTSPTEERATTDEADSADGDAETPRPASRQRAPTTTGGEGRITLAVPASEAEMLLGVEGGRVVVESRGTRREFELVSLLRRAGQRIRRVPIGRDSTLAGTTLQETRVRETYDVAIVAHRHEGRWTIGPGGEAEVAGGDEVFAVGSGPDLREFAEAVS